MCSAIAICNALLDSNELLMEDLVILDLLVLFLQDEKFVLCHFYQHSGDDDEEEEGKESLLKMR